MNAVEPPPPGEGAALVGLSTYSFRAGFARGTVTLGRFFDLCGEWGVREVQVDPSHYDPRDDGQLALIAAANDVGEGGLRVSLGSNVPLVASDDEEREALREEFDALFRACRSVGATLLRCLTGVIPRNRALPVEEQMPVVLENVALVTELARRAGVVLAFENHGDLTSGQLADLVCRVDSPNCRVTLDNGNPWVLFEDPVAAFERLAPLAAAVHFKDYQVRATGHGFEVTCCELGKGVLDLEAQLAARARHCPGAPVYLEVGLPSTRDEERVVWRSLEHARDLVTRKIPPSS
ncbi:MAG: hypothetical protein Kow0069_20380 [Promethearchaeota archaeon]